MTPKAKIAVSLPPELVERAHQAVAQGPSFERQRVRGRSDRAEEQARRPCLLAGRDARRHGRTAHRRGVGRGRPGARQRLHLHGQAPGREGGDGDPARDPGSGYKHSSPYHPQTCGKVERFHQTEKKFLAKQHPAADLFELQAQLDRFVAYYNAARPHRALGRRTPAEVFDAKIKARPAKRVPDIHFRVRHDRVDKTGCVTLRYESRLHHIGVRRAHRGRRVLLLIADKDVRVVGEEGDLIRQLTIDPSRDYQRIR